MGLIVVPRTRRDEIERARLMRERELARRRADYCRAHPHAAVALLADRSRSAEDLLKQIDALIESEGREAARQRRLDKLARR